MSANDKRVRKKSRKLSEADLDVVEEPPKKRTRVQSQLKERFKKPKRLMVSVDFNSLSSKMSSKLKCKPASSNSPVSASSNEEKNSLDQTVAPPKKEVKIKFKNPKFCYSYLNTNKKRSWKGLKQILQADKNIQWDPSMPTYSAIDAPPPLKPIKKYSDVSGVPASYTDPLTGLHYHSSEEFDVIRTLSTNSIQSYLALRGKATIT